MDYSKRGQLASLLQKYADNEEVRNLIVLLTTLVLESFAPEWLQSLHAQNMARAEFGRDSKEADKAGAELQRKLESHASSIRQNHVTLEDLKAEFLAINPKNDWTHTKAGDKAQEELYELVEYLVTMPQFSERVLDSILDAAYAGTTVTPDRELL